MKNLSTQIACHQVILQAAKIYAATLDLDTDYSGFVLIGADDILFLSDEITLASPQQRIQWQKREWMNWASSPSDLTFIGCIQWLMLQSPDDDDDDDNDDNDDCVTIEQVCAVLAGHRF